MVTFAYIPGRRPFAYIRRAAKNKLCALMITFAYIGCWRLVAYIGCLFR
jgi:uncharacterized membrane protein YhdT